jgi:arylsulfatase A-like enzyme
MPRRKPAVLANERLRIIIRASTMIIRLLHFLSLLVIPVAASATITNRPNILWIVVDDMSANFSCYGETTIRTPHVDRLAAEGVRFTRAYATAPVCSAFRSAMITGMYQTSIGSQHHRSGRGKRRIQLPDGVRIVPELFREAGYWTCIGSGLPGFDHQGVAIRKDKRGKTDYNFDWDESVYDSHDWADRKQGQPFFMQVQLHGGKIRGASEKQYDALDQRMRKEFGNITDPDRVTLPPYYPRDPVLLRDWSTYLDTVRITDRHVGRVVNRLRQEGLLDNTLILFFTDHGISHARGKQFLFDEGTHIPLVIRGPGAGRGSTRMDLAEHIDVAAISLAAAGIPIPPRMQGRDLLAEDHRPKAAVFAARDRCGEAADHIRSVRTEEYLYIRNHHPRRPLLMPNQYKDSKLIIQRLRQLHIEGGLNPLSEQLLFSPTRPSEELYRYAQDRWQTVNLADDPGHAKALREHRERLENWVAKTGDMGPESPEIYDLEITDELDFIDRRKTKIKPARYIEFKRNAETYRGWAAEGR